MKSPVTMHRAHRMPFGAEVREDGTTGFRLWAPAPARVALWLEDQARALPMTRDVSGWAGVVTHDAPPGTRYRFRIDDELLVPDPASRYQPADIHGPSEVIDPRAHSWTDEGWPGVPAERLVFYELHVGTFTPAGTFAGVTERLDHLASLGVTAIELMPIADFPGQWGWGYDGVLPFAPEARYGRPEDLKALVAACHARGIAVFLDVVYNHLGPEGNYLHRYAPAFFSRRHQTPWGDAINFDEPGSEIVRAFVVHNALYWLEEFHLDGLRLDATHTIVDDSPVHILAELGLAVANGPGRERLVHLVVEDDGNRTRFLHRPGPAGRPLYLAQWNDDIHHALHVLLTGEHASYYADYVPPVPHLGRCLAEGWAYQGEMSPYRGRARGEPSRALPATAFVAFLQNHDQIGNRALGDRITALAPAEAVRAATAILLLAPSLPLLFMGQEWGAPEPFLFFSDLGGDIGRRVAEGRRREFARFPEWSDPERSLAIPDPQSARTHQRSTLDWTRTAEPVHEQWLAFHRHLLALREKEIAPLVCGEPLLDARWTSIGETALEVRWSFTAGPVLRLIANLGPAPVAHRDGGPDWGRRLYGLGLPGPGWTELPPWSVGWFVAERDR